MHLNFEEESMPRITVIGAGFGALTAIRKLRASDTGVQIDVIAPKPEFVYFPGYHLDSDGLTQTRRPGSAAAQFFPAYESNLSQGKGHRPAGWWANG